MVKVKLMDQLTSTYHHDRRHKTWYYLRLFFDLWDMTLVNAYIFYCKLTQKKLSHLGFQVIVVKSLATIGEVTHKHLEQPRVSTAVFLRKHHRIYLR